MFKVFHGHVPNICDKVFTNNYKIMSMMLGVLNIYTYTLLWRHNGYDGVSNHQPHDCLLNCLFKCRSKKTSKLRDSGLCVGNSPVTDEFPAQMASNAKNVSIWWRHHDLCVSNTTKTAMRCQGPMILNNLLKAETNQMSPEVSFKNHAENAY